MAGVDAVVTRSVATRLPVTRSVVTRLNIRCGRHKTRHGRHKIWCDTVVTRLEK
jgi:hypothetical protein